MNIKRWPRQRPSAHGCLLIQFSSKVLLLVVRVFVLHDDFEEVKRMGARWTTYLFDLALSPGGVCLGFSTRTLPASPGPSPRPSPWSCHCWPLLRRRSRQHRQQSRRAPPTWRLGGLGDRFAFDRPRLLFLDGQCMFLGKVRQDRGSKRVTLCSGMACSWPKVAWPFLGGT